MTEKGNKKREAFED